MPTKPNPEKAEIQAGFERVLQGLIDQFLAHGYPPFSKTEAEKLLEEMASNFIQQKPYFLFVFTDARVGSFYTTLSRDHQLRQAFSNRIMEWRYDTREHS